MIKDSLKNMIILLSFRCRWRIVQQLNKERFMMLRRHGIRHIKLTSEQRKEVDKVYKRYKSRFSYATHELYLSVTGNFNAYILPEDFYVPFPVNVAFPCKHPMKYIL